MSDKLPREIPLESGEILQKLYSRDWPKHILISNSFRLLLKQIKKFPELKCRLKIFALSEDWQSDGAFYAIVSLIICYQPINQTHVPFHLLAQFICNELESFVFFDSFDDLPSDALKNALMSLDYSKLIVFFAVRSVFRPMTFQMIEDMNLVLHDDTNAICHILPKEEAKLFEVP